MSHIQYVGTLLKCGPERVGVGVGEGGDFSRVSQEEIGASSHRRTVHVKSDNSLCGLGALKN